MPFKLLIVDDEENVRNSLVRQLRKEDYEILTASSAAEAMEILLEEPVDLIISDEKMPSISGLDFLKMVKQRHPETMRFILTGHADVDLVIRAVNQGEVYRFFTKPWDNEELKSAIRSALHHLSLIRENRNLLETVRRQAQELETLRRQKGIPHALPAGKDDRMG